MNVSWILSTARHYCGTFELESHKKTCWPAERLAYVDTRMTLNEDHVEWQAKLNDDHVEC